jgi:hypothetical protein
LVISKKKDQRRMKIHEAAKKLVDLGVPGKEKKRAITNAVKNRPFNNKTADVKSAIEKYVEKALVRWAYTEEIITKPERHKDETGRFEKGRGKNSDWLEKAVYEAAAVWAVRDRAKKIAAEGGRKKKTLSAKEICEIRRHAKGVFASPCMEYEPPSNITITTPNPSFIYDFRALTPKIVADAALNDLVIAWIAATAKAQKKWKISEPAQVIFSWRHNPEHYPSTDTGNIAGAYEGPPPPSKEFEDFTLQHMPEESEIKKLVNLLYQRRIESSDAVDFLHAGKGKMHATDPEEVEHQFLFDDINVKSAESNKDELVILLDGQDSRIKALYAPVELYSPDIEYGRKYRDHRY